MSSCAPPDPPEEDVELADRLGVTFVLVTKMARRQRWIRFHGPAGLRATFRALRHAPSGRVPWEVGVFRLHATGIGTFYWSSRFPDVFNSTVIDMVVH
jgi:hypothetical protein